MQQDVVNKRDPTPPASGHGEDSPATPTVGVPPGPSLADRDGDADDYPDQGPARRARYNPTPRPPLAVVDAPPHGANEMPRPTRRPNRHWARRLLIGASVVASLAWVVVGAYYVDQAIGMSAVRLLLPHEYGGLAAGLFLPLAFLWLFVAYIDRGNEMRSEAEALRAFLDRLAYPADQSAEEVARVADSLRRQTDALNQASATAIARAEGARGIFDKETEGIERVTARVVEALDSVTDRLLDRVRLMEEAVSVQAGELSVASDTSVRRLKDVEGALERQAKSLAAVTEDAQKRLMGIADLLQNSESRIAEATGRTAQSLGTVDARMSSSAAGLEGAMRGVAKTAEEVAAGVGDQADTLGRKAGEAREQADAISAALERQTQSLSDTAKLVAAKVELSEASLGQQARVLNGTAERVLTDIREVVENLQHYADMLIGNAQRIDEALGATATNLRDEGASVTEAAVSAVNRIADSGTAMKAQAKALTEAAKVIVNGLGAVDGALQSRSAALSDAAGKVLGDLDSVTDALSKKAGAMTSAAGRAAKSVATVQLELNQTMAAVEETIARGVETTTTACADLRDTAAETAARAVALVDDIRLVGDAARGQVTGLGQAVTTAGRGADDVLSDMQDKAVQVIAAAQQLQSNVENLASATLDHAEKLIDRATEVEAQADVLAQRHERVTTDSLLRDTTVILGHLEEAAVDINRLFNPTVDQDLWKRYYAGDTAAFLRHAARNLSRRQAGAIRDMYENNADFRGCVNRYLTEYEQLCESVKDTDKGQVLGAVFAGSDIGRLHLILSTALDRRSAAVSA